MRTKTPWHRRLLLVVGILVLVALVRARWFGPEATARAAAAAARAELRAQGFKTELGEFDLATTAQGRARGDAIFAAAAVLDRVGELRGLDLMSEINPGRARVAWREERWLTHREADLWPGAIKALRQHQPTLAGIAAAVRDGPVQFEIVRSGTEVEMTHLVPLKLAARTLAGATATALHAGDVATAWTNLAALSDLLAHWSPEPPPMSHLVQLQVLQLAAEATWEALQTNAWTDAQLSQLQQRWAGLDLLSRLPEAAAFARVEGFLACEARRNDAVMSMTERLAEFLNVVFQNWNSPAEILGWARENFRAWGRQVRDRKRLSYEEERALALQSRILELRLRDATRTPSGMVLLECAAAGEGVLYPSLNAGSRSDDPRGVQTPGRPAEVRRGSLPERVARGEALRRIVMAALAVERTRLRDGALPEQLDRLDPEFLPIPPTDFFDGMTLRYRQDSQGFLIYSVGMNFKDDNGKGAVTDVVDVVGRQTPDLVWPLPATSEEVRHLEEMRLPHLRRGVSGRPPSPPTPQVLRRFGPDFVPPQPPPIPTIP